MIVFKKLLTLLFLFVSIISFSQNSERDLIDIAINDIRSGKNREAIKILNKVIKENKKSTFAYNIRSIAKTNLGKYKSALKDLDNAIQISPNYADAYFNKGHIKEINLHDHYGAIREYNKAIGLDSTNHFYYSNRGNCKAELSNYEDALDDYNKSISINPNTPFIYINRAVTLKELGRFEDSLNDCDLAISLDSLYMNPYYLKGVLLNKLGKIEDACLNLIKARELGNKKVEAFIKKFCE